MKYLNRFWIRLLLSVAGGLVGAETIIASTGTGFYEPFLICIWIGIVYITLTGIVWVYNWNHANSEE